MKTYEYIWLDGYKPEPMMRSKVKATEDETPPEWSFDGSSTQQAEGGSSDCLLIPVQTYSNPDGHDLVMTEVQSADHSTHPSNFRAAAAEQLNEWADKIGTDFVRDADKSDPASVVYKSIAYANKNNIDVVIIDTAGRLQNKTDLMDQLGKIDRVLKKHDETLPHDSIISIDATTGQNALKQVEEFNKFTKITGIIMTKFDSNAAGGTLVSISNKTKIPILAIGSGEQISDLIDFDPEQFSNNFIKN